jgi:hypothetical protein
VITSFPALIGRTDLGETLSFRERRNDAATGIRYTVIGRTLSASATSRTVRSAGDASHDFRVAAIAPINPESTR